MKPEFVTSLKRAYLANVESYEAMQSTLRILDGIARGERALLENRTCTESEAKQKMAKWLA